MASSSIIKMGNDEFILYIRKTSDCKTHTNVLGSQISKWFKSQAIEPKDRDVKCFWEIHGASIDEEILPKTAAQFEFDRAILPELYSYLDKLKNQ
ncbi:hypothetical protein HNS38_16780 [Lentimicrobium sp. L6]|uniref:hypothetical protein n=1 Tax=Lentimicrobium sp. L6 TaxID=2735916 RepID=UPI001554CDF3|nr:hypothetical protein [Lentimicrobium sp. L6]NPD86430.1 hypothetical protein [Lentimicrobium sp. L6]